MNRLNVSIVNASTLEEADIQSMYVLYKKYYAGTDCKVFKDDLKSKDFVALGVDSLQKIQGFSTLKIVDALVGGEKIRYIFSGDTIIDSLYWGDQRLVMSICELMGQVKVMKPKTPLYWLLISKGHRTYRYLRVFSRQYFPNRAYDTPDYIKVILNHVASKQFGDEYNPSKGLVEYSNSQVSLRHEWSNESISDNLEADFFFKKNPNFSHGDELVCITELCKENLHSYALRAFLQGIERGPLG
jgi:hypothetical protein